MPSLKDLKVKLSTIESVNKITRAMKMISAARMSRLSHGLEKIKIYHKKMDEIALSIANVRYFQNHELVASRKIIEKIKVVVFASNRGLCGSYNENILIAVFDFLEGQTNPNISFDIVGKKGMDIVNKLKRKIDDFKPQSGTANFELDKKTMQGLVEKYKAKEFDELYFVHSAFVNAMKQVPVVEKILPIPVEKPTIIKKDYAVIEPDAKTFVEYFIEKYLIFKYHASNFEAMTSENAARLAAMSMATKNGEEMMKSLRLEYNKLRQAAITKELMEIISGVKAME